MKCPAHRTVGDVLSLPPLSSPSPQVTMFVIHGLPGLGSVATRVTAEAWMKSDTNLQITMLGTIVLPQIFDIYKKAGMAIPQTLCLQTDRG